MAEDGSIVINVDLDNKEAEKELVRLGKQIDKLEKTLSGKQQTQSGIKQQLDAAKDAALETERTIDRLKKELAGTQAITSGGVSSSPSEFIAATEKQELLTAQLSEQEAILLRQDKETQRLDQQYTRITDQVIQAKQNLNSAKDAAGALQQQLAKSNLYSKALSDAMENAEKGAARFASRLKEVVRSALVFTVISQGLAALREWLSRVIETNAEASAAMARLRGALLTLAQPLLNVIIPAFTAFLNVLTAIVGAVAELLSSLFGMTIDQSAQAAENLYSEQNAIEGVGAAAEEAAGSLAGFDEINTIQTEKNAGGGGGGAASSTPAPDFSWTDGIGEKLKEIADLILLIGAGFALWKIGTMLPGVLGTIATTLGSILMTVGGLLLYWNGLTDAWENGVDWPNLIMMIGGLAAAAFGLYQLLGPIASGISLVVGGLAMLVTGFRDAMTNGWNLQNVLTAIAGILATGLGIFLITGSWIPLLIAGIASLLLAFTVATGHGEELLNGIRTILEGFVDFFTGIFSGDIEKAIGGIQKICEGLKTAIGAIIDGIRDTILSFLTWLDEKTGGKLHGIIEAIKTLFIGAFDTIKTMVSNVITAVQQILTGITQFISGVFTNDWDTAWEGIKNIFKGVWNALISILEGAINLIITGLNWLISQMNKISFTAPSWVPGIGGKSIGINIPLIPEASLPRLAAGAVIPPNREFLAVLGDQKAGNNIEAPEALIRRIVREESGGMNTELLQAILEAIRAGQVIKVNETTLGRTAAKAINKVTRSAGKPILEI